MISVANFVSSSPGGEVTGRAPDGFRDPAHPGGLPTPPAAYAISLAILPPPGCGRGCHESSVLDTHPK